jgi:hypothetical protein
VDGRYPIKITPKKLSEIERQVIGVEFWADRVTIPRYARDGTEKCPTRSGGTVA